MTGMVTFGVVNCNRLHYLKSCVESLLDTTSEYADKELIIVDNASVEPGTREYLLDVAQRVGAHVVIRTSRDPSNEFAKGLNEIAAWSVGDFVCMLQGDMQFVRKGWLREYIELYDAQDGVGCVTLDAQRNITNSTHRFESTKHRNFLFDLDRPGVAGAADVFIDRRTLTLLGSWEESNLAHEGGADSETKMLKHVRDSEELRRLRCAVPLWPAACAIYTDPRGTNARVRGNRRYGQYWPARDGFKYYDYYEPTKDALTRPLGIENVAKPLGWSAPLDTAGNWLKNPIRPEHAAPSDYIELDDTQNVVM